MSSPSQPKLKLYYFDIKGKGEPIRLLCHYAGLQLEDHRFASRDEFSALRDDGTLPFGQVPLLQVTEEDGTVHYLVQSAAILRYLSKLAGLYPEDPLVAAKVDAALDQETDAFTGLTVATYTTRFGIHMTNEQKEAAFHQISKEVLPRHLGNLERLLKASATGWIAGTPRVSAADFAWYSRLHDGVMESTTLDKKITTLSAYPCILAFIAKFKGLHEIQAYYAK